MIYAKRGTARIIVNTFAAKTEHFIVSVDQILYIARCCGEHNMREWGQNYTQRDCVQVCTGLVKGHKGGNQLQLDDNIYIGL